MKRLTPLVHLALSYWMMCRASAQDLPELAINELSNHAVTVTWPYTNSGFALQEATNLTAGGWRSSSLSTDFDSNLVSTCKD